MNGTPSIACIIANYNNSKYLERCVLSVLTQTCRVDEIIIADDASTDDSCQIIEALASKYANITPIYREKNIGVSKNRHQAVISSSAQFITTLDSDDLFYPTKIESELDAILLTGSDIAFSDIIRIDEYDNVKERFSLEYFDKLANDERVGVLIRREKAIPRDMLFNRVIYDEIGGFSCRLKVYEDFELKMRILLSTDAKWAYSHACGTGYRAVPGGLSKTRPVRNMIILFWILIYHSQAIINKIGFGEFIISIVSLVFFHIGKFFSLYTK